MKKATQERNIAVGLFVMVLIVFTFAERDSKKIIPLYSKENVSARPVVKQAAPITPSLQMAAVAASGQN
ncbi:MAG TPA: hypothetical protein VHK91_03125 [Flavisolibacter sp.]|jgi:hypothetical protein|nr:hypothetical protein [Flavisolibacter sp.]